ncbi:hypothetical protein AB0D09_28260 [Streptomyces sp. NPDC049097]
MAYAKRALPRQGHTQARRTLPEKSDPSLVDLLLIANALGIRLSGLVD